MSFKRTGKCNQCGECCGFPRATDGGQNNPWPLEWPESVSSWSPEVIEAELPIFKLIQFPVQACPFLKDRKCDLVGSEYEYIWHKMCDPVPPLEFETLEQVRSWQSNCPSCSFVYSEE